MGTKDEIKSYALIGFLLLAVLFGMQIMTFIFGQLGNSNTYVDITQNTINETEVWLNQTSFTISRASDSNFTGGFVITALWNGTDQGEPGDYNVTIPLANATYFSANGTFKSADFLYNSTNVSISYYTTHKSDVEVISDSINNNSLVSIQTYSSEASTQFNVLQIVITLILLVGVFVFFWKTFMGKKKDSSGGSFG